jgi:adenylate cyclase
MVEVYLRREENHRRHGEHGRPGAVVRGLEVFSAFDGLALDLGLEKIKTIGDAYMVASGLFTHRPRARGTSSGNGAREAAGIGAARDAPASRRPRHRAGRGRRDRRQRFIYDLWGNTVNTASRMESHGLSGEIQVTERAYQRLCASYAFVERGTIHVKGMGEMRTWFLRGRRQQ